MSADKKILLRIPTSLHEQVKARAKAAKISINSLIQRYIEQGALGVTALAGSGEIIKAADAQFGLNFIGLMLFGSRARGDAHDTSDTDLLLVVEPSVRIDRALYRYWDHNTPEGISIQISHLPAMPSEAGSLWLECALDGRILHDPSGRIADFLNSARSYITSGAVVRKTTHGQGFWVPI
jgi:hypothetical protein